MLDAWDIYLRSTEGKPVSETEFDSMILPMRLMELAKEYDISYNPDEIIPTDKDYIQSIYDAAVSLLVDVGYYNSSTGRIISFDEYEIKHNMRMQPGEFNAGQGADAVHVVNRKFEDERAPPIIGGPCGGPITEDYYLKIMQSYAMEPSVSCVHTGTLLTVNGCEVKSKTTSEMMAARREITMTREALRRAGRPGLSILGTMSGTGSEAQCFGYSPDGLRSNCDRLLVSLLNELKVDWDVLKKALFCQQNELDVVNCMATVVGGYLGGPETTMIGLTAECIAGFLLLGGHSMNVTTPNDAITADKSFAGSLYALAGANAALTQNTNAIINQYCSVSSGTGSEKAMIEIMAVGGAATASGASAIVGPSTANTIKTNTYGGMDARVLEGAINAFAGMGLEEANEKVVALIKNYGGFDASNFKAAPARPFEELYDQRTLRPTREFEDLWKNTKVKITDMVGLEFAD
ncbi:MAG: monomethylamine:corrinoid methyltransferase [Methanosarcinaceae archaeon]|nr:monomethylamine:corrinoid methyltransferase [Methanosarcinaceae archaeon]